MENPLSVRENKVREKSGDDWLTCSDPSVSKELSIINRQNVVMRG